MTPDERKELVKEQLRLTRRLSSVVRIWRFLTEKQKEPYKAEFERYQEIKKLLSLR